MVDSASGSWNMFHGFLESKMDLFHLEIQRSLCDPAALSLNLF